MNLPTIKDINPIECDLDGQSAVRAFNGKTLKDAENMFCQAFECYTENLMFMGPKAFSFYLKAVISYIKSDKSQGDDSVFLLASTLNYKIANEKNDIAYVINDIKNLVKYVLDNWNKFSKDYKDDDDKYEWQKVKRNLGD